MYTDIMKGDEVAILFFYVFEDEDKDDPGPLKVFLIVKQRWKWVTFTRLRRNVCFWILNF